LLTFVFHKVAQKRIYRVVGSLIITLYTIANSLQSVPVKEFRKSVNN